MSVPFLFSTGMKDKIKDILIVLLALLALFYGLWVHIPQEESPVIQGHIDSVAIKQRQIDSLLIEAERSRLELDSIRASEKSSRKAFKMRQAALEREKAKTEAQVRAMADTIPVLAAYIEASDSLEMVHLARIAQLEEEKERQRQAFEKSILLANERADLATEVGQHLNQVVSEYQRQERKFKNQSTGLKLATAGAFILGVLVGK